MDGPLSAVRGSTISTSNRYARGFLRRSRVEAGGLTPSLDALAGGCRDFHETKTESVLGIPYLWKHITHRSASGMSPLTCGDTQYSISDKRAAGPSVAQGRMRCDGQLSKRGVILSGVKYADQPYDVRGSLEECQAHARAVGRSVWARLTHPSGDEQTLIVEPVPPKKPRSSGSGMP